MATHTKDIVVIGASAGGLEPLEQLVSDLPPNFPAAIFVVVHVPATSISHLPEILGRKGPLSASHPPDGNRIRHGHVYVAPPDQHLVINDGHIQLSPGPKENRARPAVNPLFRSAALAYGPRVIGVVLSGSLDDGTAGLWEIKQRGGTTIVQDPMDAQFSDMPRNALENVPIDYVTPSRGLAALLMDLVGQPADLQTHQEEDMEEVMKDFQRTELTCPDCRGPISESRNGTKEYRCRVGHRYSPQSYLANQEETQERTLWAALLALEEGVDVARELATHSKPVAKRRYEQDAENKAHAAGKIRELIAFLTKAHSDHISQETKPNSVDDEADESAT